MGEDKKKLKYCGILLDWSSTNKKIINIFTILIFIVIFSTTSTFIFNIVGGYWGLILGVVTGFLFVIIPILVANLLVEVD